MNILQRLAILISISLAFFIFFSHYGENSETDITSVGSTDAPCRTSMVCALDEHKSVNESAIYESVNVSVIYETHCIDSAMFINQQLWPVFLELEVGAYFMSSPAKACYVM